MKPGTDPSFRSYNKFRIYSHQNIKGEIKYRHTKTTVQKEVSLGKGSLLLRQQC